MTARGALPPALVALYRHGRVVPFVGAGISMAVTWRDASGNQRRGPSWTEERNQAARQLGFEPADLLRYRGTDLQILEYYGLKNAGYSPD